MDTESNRPRAVPRPDALVPTLRRCWSIGSSTRWTPENPAAGQCGVTALVLHDRFGGEILKTRVGDVWHFYNRIEGRRVDLTAEQFPEPVRYDDAPSDRADAFTDATPEQYAHLARRVAAELDS